MPLLPGHYKVNFTDPSTPGSTGQDGYFVIEPYTTDGSLHPISQKRADSSNTISTSLLIPGRSVPNYGERVAENFVQILENFSSPIPPVNPINGQLWYDTGLTFSVIDGVIQNSATEDDELLISGDHVTRIQQIIDEDQLLIDPAGEINPAGNLNLVGSNDLTAIYVRPTSVVLDGGNTRVSILPSSLTGYTTLADQQYYATVPSDRNTLRIYDDARDQTGTAGWGVVSAAYVSAVQPEEIEAGELWIDTSTTPAEMHFYDGTVFSDPFLTTEGGTLTGTLILDGPPVVDNQAASKGYVDTAILAALTLTDIGQIVIDIAALQSDVLVLQTDTTTLQTDIDTLQLTLDNAIILAGLCLDVSGGTMTGDITFEIPDNTGIPDNESSGIIWDGIGALAGGNFLRMSSYHEVSPVDFISHKLTLESASVIQVLDFVHKEQAGPETTLMQVRKEGVLTPIGMYEVDPTTIDIDATPDPLTKLISLNDFNNEIDALGNLVTGFTWNATTLVLTAIGINGNFDVNLDHSHNILGQEYDITPLDDVNEKIGDYFQGATNNLISIDSAIRSLDILTPARQNAHFNGLITNTTPIVPESVSIVGNSINILNTATDVLIPLSGDVLSSSRAAVAGWLQVAYSATITGIDPTGLANDATVYTVTFEIDRSIDITINVAGQDAQTYQDLVNELNTGLGVNATAVILTTEIQITSSREDALSLVEIPAGNLFSQTNDFDSIGTSIPGEAEEQTALLTIQTVTEGVSETTITVAEDLTTLGLSTDDIAVVNFTAMPTNSSHLTTLKYVNEAGVNELIESNNARIVNAYEMVASQVHKTGDLVGVGGQNRACVFGSSLDNTPTFMIGSTDSRVVYSYDQFETEYLHDFASEEVRDIVFGSVDKYDVGNRFLVLTSGGGSGSYAFNNNPIATFGDVNDGWTVVSPTLAQYYQAGTFGQGKFVIVGDGGRVTIIDPADMLSQTTNLVPGSPDLIDVAFANDRFVAIGTDGGNHRVYYSDDAITWTLGIDFGGNFINSIAGGTLKDRTDIFVIGTNNGIVTTPDGDTYSAGTDLYAPASLGDVDAVGYVDGVFFAIDANNGILYSTTSGYLRWIFKATDAEISNLGNTNSLTGGDGQLLFVNKTNDNHAMSLQVTVDSGMQK